MAKKKGSETGTEFGLELESEVGAVGAADVSAAKALVPLIKTRLETPQDAKKWVAQLAKMVQTRQIPADTAELLRQLLALFLQACKVKAEVDPKDKGMLELSGAVARAAARKAVEGMTPDQARQILLNRGFAVLNQKIADAALELDPKDIVEVEVKAIEQRREADGVGSGHVEDHGVAGTEAEGNPRGDSGEAGGGSGTDGHGGTDRRDLAGGGDLTWGPTISPGTDNNPGTNSSKESQNSTVHGELPWKSF
jgi:hypothetical protein